MMADGIDHETYPEPGWELPSRVIPAWTDCPGDVIPAPEDPWEREGLWIVVHRDAGDVGVVDAPEPARTPIQ